MNNLGFITDCLYHKLQGIVEDKYDYVLIKTPSNPGYHWGNLLFFEKAPEVGCFDHWMDLFLAEFGEDSGHVTFAWNEQSKGKIDEFESAGFEWDEQIVLRLKEATFDFSINDKIQVKKINSDEEWKAVTELQILVSDQETTPEFIAFKEKGFAAMRSIQSRGYGHWWGAYIGDRLVADMGLFFDYDNQLGRFQSVETHPEFQNQRICKTLLKTVVESAFEETKISDLVIVTELSNHARHVYQSCGFEDHSKQCGICLPKPYWK